MENKKRLIDANEAIEKLKDIIQNRKEAGLQYQALKVAYIAVADCSTVDAVEVIHAHWDNNGICTMCGYPIPTDSKYDFIDKDDCLFCYHCGAKMGGDGNG